MHLHPLDPLTPEEISLAAQLVREKLIPTLEKELLELISGESEAGSDKLRFIFNSIILKEPPKAKLLPKLLDATWDFSRDSSIPRVALVVVLEKSRSAVFEILVNLSTESVDKWEKVKEGHQPTLTPDDCFDSERIAKSDPRVVERCQKLGYHDMNLVVGDPWSVGYSGDEKEFENKRLVQLFMYARQFDQDNHYAHPLDFVTVVDMNREQVLRIEDLPIHSDFKPRRNGPVKVPQEPLNYDPKFLAKDFLRKDVKPLQIISPQGPSFEVDGNFIRWQNFQFRISFNYREGLVLHNVQYQDGPKLRPLLYRASISEMVVPYGDPRPPFHRKSAFDVGDYGLGFCANSLTLGCDCVGTIKYFDAVLNDHEGRPTVIKNAVCLHEEDAGMLWKHTEYRTGKVNVTRSRVLVLSFIVTVVNYEYGFYWTFSQDGSISFQVKATGELSTNLLAEGESPAPYGTIIAPQISGQFHQHIFNVRLDTMIDGPKNTVHTVDVKPLDAPPGGERNPFGQGFEVVERPLKTAAEARTDVCSETSRSWKISSDSTVNPITKAPTAWKLVPVSSAVLMAQPGSKIRARAAFAEHSVWVTRHNDEELYAAGFYVNQSKGGDGLPRWILSKENQESIVDQDVVLWHSFGVTHTVRIEDFPIMNCETCGFTLKPSNFFTTNPALDVPPTNKEINSSTQVLSNAGENGCCH